MSSPSPLIDANDPFLSADPCAREPIHIIGHIQSHGVLFALSEPDYSVRQVSANVGAVLGMPPHDVLERSFEAILGSAQFARFRTQLEIDDLQAANPLRFLVGSAAVEMNCTAHRYDGALIAELELCTGAHSLEPLSIGAHCRIPLSRMEHAADIFDLSRVAAMEIRRLSGFERVMMYRFDDEWNGEVIAEACGDSALSYLGLRFPASDIPAQARRLFLLNPLRAIADVASQPVPIVPAIGPLTGRPLDLTRSCLRSASPVHIEYLRNMGVQATMTVSIVVRGRLWGIIACHHSRPHIVDSSTRSVSEHIGQFLASHVASRIDNAHLQARLAARTSLENYMVRIEASSSRSDADSFQDAGLLDLLDADGLIARMGDVVMHRGAVQEETLLPIIDRLRSLSSRGIASSNMLEALDGGADAYAADASGALYIGLSDQPGDYLLLVRRELVETVTWAGNPDKAVSADAQGALRPRTSFTAWQETVRGRSRPWTKLELENASFLREQLLRLREAQRLHKSEAKLREKNRLMAMAEQTAHIGHWRLDLVALELFWSDEVYRTYGLTRTHNPTLATALSYYHPDDRARVEAVVGAAVASGDPFTYESRIVRPDGTIRYVVASGQAECAPDGTVIAVFGVFADVTDTKNAERERERLIVRVNVATQAAQVGIWDWDVVTNLVLWDPIMFALYGFDNAAFTPTYERWTSSLHDDDRARAEREIAKARSGDGPFDSEFRVVWPNGEVHFIRVMATLVYDEAGMPQRMIGTNWDITEVRTLGDQLREEKDAATFAAAHDTLTGLLNRRGLQAWIESQPDIAATLLYLDIDGFKAVNDRGGHAAGDDTLRHVAHIIRAAVRDRDRCARMGGDEFLVVLVGGVDSETTTKVIARITSAVASLCPLGEGVDTRIGMSIGVGQLARANLLDEALREADTQLYERKRERKEVARLQQLDSAIVEPAAS